LANTSSYSFACVAYRRNTNFIRIPTTVIGLIDASVSINAELIKISTCSHLDTFNLLDKYCEQLINQSFGRANDSSQELIDTADKINREGIHEMLKLETPNLYEIGLDRVIAHGHTWSPIFHRI
jgi:3-dehydroquinate synthase